MDSKKFETLMYFLIKEASRESFVNFLEYSGLSEDEYNEIKYYLQKTYDIKMYL